MVIADPWDRTLPGTHYFSHCDLTTTNNVNHFMADSNRWLFFMHRSTLLLAPSYLQNSLTVNLIQKSHVLLFKIFVGYEIKRIQTFS